VGAPEFDKAFLIPSLSLEERRILALLALSSIDDVHPLQNIIESNATNKTTVDITTTSTTTTTTTAAAAAAAAAAVSYEVDGATVEKNGNDDDDDDDDDDRTQGPHQHQSHRERNMHAWASGIANLSMGYAPGDIIAVIHRMVLIHTGKKSISVPSISSSSSLSSSSSSTSSSSSSISSSSSFSISWKSLLEAITIVRPKAVASLSSIYSHDSMSSMFDASHQLTWSDFIGYHDIVNDLKRRLHYFQSSPLASINPLPVIQSQSKSQGRSGFGINEMGFKGMVIAGPSGCGKSLLAKVLASEVRHHHYYRHYHYYYHHNFYYHSHHHYHYNHHYIIVLTFHYPHILYS
jgi:hypothetical protein